MDSGCKFCIGGMNVNCVGIDVSKGKSMIAVMRPLGEMVIPPFEVGHTDAELCELSRRLRDLDGETRVVMEATGNYHLPVASFLYDSGFYVSVVNAMLVHGYGNNSLRRAKTDKKDAIKLANYGLDHWLALPKYIPEDEVRLKYCFNRSCLRTTCTTALCSSVRRVSMTDTVRVPSLLYCLIFTSWLLVGITSSLSITDTSSVCSFSGKSER